MRYIWTFLQAQMRGFKVGRDGIKDVTGDFTNLFCCRVLEIWWLNFCAAERVVNVSITFCLFILFST